MNMKKITAFAAAVVIAAGICTGVPTGTENGSLLAVAAEAADNGFIIETDENGDKYVSGYTGNGGDITIPDGVKYIGSGAFAGNQNITSATFPKSCIEVRKEAFIVCSDIKRLVFNGDTVIGLAAFHGCDKLESIVFNSNAIIGEKAFYDCKKLENVTVKGSIKPTDDCCGIEADAFMFCESLKTVKISKNNYEFKIAERAFQNCFSLEIINIPSKCIEIKDCAFLSCYNLEKITIPTKTKLSEYSIGYCIIKTGNNVSARVADGKTSGYHSFYDNIPVTPMITIAVTKGSPAEEYCKENGIKYVYVDGSAPTVTTKENTPATAPAAKKLAAPTGVNGAVSQDKIVLTWNKVDGAKGYRVYKYDEKTGKYLKYKDVKNEKCTVNGLKSGTKYKFKIYALVSENGKFVVQTPSNAFSFTTKAEKKPAETFNDEYITL